MQSAMEGNTKSVGASRGPNLKEERAGLFT